MSAGLFDTGALARRQDRNRAPWSRRVPRRLGATHARDRHGGGAARRGQDVAEAAEQRRLERQHNGGTRHPRRVATRSGSTWAPERLCRPRPASVGWGHRVLVL